MAEQLYQVLDRFAVEPFGHELPGLSYCRVLHRLRVGHLVNAALLRQAPAVHPVAHIKGAVRADRAIGGQDLPYELVVVGHLEAGPLRFDPEGEDSAVARPTAEIREEEVALVAVGEADARVRREAGWAVRKVLERRQQVSSLSFWAPELFVIPRPAVALLDR